MHCRRAPPRQVSPTEATFPFVNETVWCGEHRFSLRAWLRHWRNRLRRWRNKRKTDAGKKDRGAQEGRPE